MEISGVDLFRSQDFKDQRGLFRKTYSPGIETFPFQLREAFYSITEPGVFRGLHLQTSESESGRIISLISGEVIDVLIDLRKTSTTFMKVMEIPWSRNDDLSAIYVPPGVAHGFFAVEESTLLYLSDNTHVPALDSGVNVNSVSVSFKSRIISISERDSQLPDLVEWA